MQVIIPREDIDGIAQPPRVTLAMKPDEKVHTQQQFADDADINVIMRKWAKDGVDPQANRTVPRFGDFSEVDSYQDANQAIINANADFAELPAAIRRRMENDPAKLLGFLADAANEAEAIELGLLPNTGPEAGHIKTDPAPSAPPPEAPEETLSPPKPTPIAGGE